MKDLSAERQTGRQADRQIHVRTDRQADTFTDKLTGRPTDRHVDRRTDRRRDRQTSEAWAWNTHGGEDPAAAEVVMVDHHHAVDGLSDGAIVHEVTATQVHRDLTCGGDNGDTGDAG